MEGINKGGIRPVLLEREDKYSTPRLIGGLLGEGALHYKPVGGSCRVVAL